MKVHSSYKLVVQLILIGVTVMVFADAEASAQGTRNLNVNAGEIIQVRMEDTISTRTARRGQRFETSVIDPVMATNGTMVIPRGSIIYGRIVAYQRPQRRGRPGTLDVTFFSIKFPNGRESSLDGSLSSQDEREGQVKGNSVSRGKVLFVGTSGGAVIGAIASGGSGAVAGGLIGATGAALTSRFTSGSHAEVKRNTEFGIYLNRNLSLPPY